MELEQVHMTTVMQTGAYLLQGQVTGALWQDLCTVKADTRSMFFFCLLLLPLFFSFVAFTECL